MNLIERERDLRAAFARAIRTLQPLRGALRTLRPHVVDADVAANIEALSASNPALRLLLRNRQEQQRIVGETHHEVLTARRRHAGIALHPLRALAQHPADWRELVARMRRDVSRSFVGALDGLDPSGMIMLDLLRETLRPAIERASVDDLLRQYPAALESRSARGLIEAELIEQRIERGGVAAKGDDLPRLKQLRQLIADVQETRLPTDLPDFDALAEDIARLQERARLLDVVPVDPERDTDAAAAYQAQEQALLDAGAASDADDLRAVQQQLGQAV